MNQILNKSKLFLLEEIVKKNFSVKYKESVLGILWSVLKPLLIMIILTIIFSTLFKRTVVNYPVYFLSGKCLYDFFSSATNLSAASIKSNKNILKRVASPKYIFVLGAIISEFLNFIITLFILVIVMIVTKCPFPFLTMPLSLLPIISLFMIITGIGLILSVLCVIYSDIQHLWGVIALMGMYASAIFYPMDITPEPFRQYMMLNPIFWAIDQFRAFAIYGNMADALNVINLLLISSIILVFGIIVYKKYEKKITTKL